jgi:hypothetical protein
MVGPEGPAAGFKRSDELGLVIKNLLRERNGASEKSKAPTGHVSLKIA